MGCANADQLRPDHPEGKTVYYTVITQEGVQDYKGRYDYELPAYDEQGNERTLEFSASKQLRQGAYLKLYHTPLRGVTYWEEVTFDQLPVAVQQKYKEE